MDEQLYGYEKYMATCRGRPSPAAELIHKIGRPMTTGEIAAALNASVIDMGKRLKALERKGILTRIDKSMVVGATWRFAEPSDRPEAKPPIRFSGWDGLEAMRRKAKEAT